MTKGGGRAERFALFFLSAFAILCVLSLISALLRETESTLFYLGPIVVLGLLALITRLGGEARIGAALTVVSLGVSVGMAEIALYATESGHYRRTVDFQEDRIRAARRQGASYDLRTRLEVVDDLNARGVSAVARVPPADFRDLNGLAADNGRLYPLAGISHATTIACNESGEWILFQSDEHGFRNPIGQYQPGALDVGVVGDSYAFGSCVAQGEEVSELLRRSGRRVLSIAYAGNGPLIELAALKEYAEPLRPRAILWFYWEENDLLNLASESRSNELTKYLDPEYSQDLMARQTEVDRLLRAHHDRMHERATTTEHRRRRCVVLLCGVRALVARFPSPTAESAPTVTPTLEPDRHIEMLGEVLRSARDRVEAWGGEFYLVYLTGWGRYSTEVDDGQYALRRQVLDVLSESEIEVIDFHEVLGNHPDPMSLFPFRSRGHYNRDGYALLAEFVEMHLEAALAPPS